MSATADERKLTKYFEDIESVINCLPRSVSVPGRIFPVDEFFLEDVIEKTGWFITASTQDAAFYSKEFSKNNYFDDGDEDEQRLNDIDLPYDVDDYSGATLSTLKTIDHSRINFELIQRLLEWIEEQSHNGSGLFDIRGGEANDDSDDDDGPRAAGRRRDRSGEAILIFLPGMPQISRLYNQLSQHEFFGDSSRALLVPLHSMIASKDQQKAFDAPPRGVRKIVLSTNIAETGVTIPDVVFVIDSGKVKQQKYHEPTNTSSLKEVFVSRAEAIQRKGRAGRVRPGFCFRLYTKKRFDKRFLESAIPELLRCSLTELTLNVLIGGFQPSLFQEALDPPLLSRVQHAVSLLRDVGCCNEEEGEGVAGSSSSYRITPLGRALALLPVDLRVGKMLLLSQLFGGSDFVLSAAAALSNAKSPFLEPFDEGGRESAKAKQRLYFTRLVTKSGGCVFSDHLAAAEALRDFEGCKGQGEQFNLCRVNQLSSQAMAQIKGTRVFVVWEVCVYCVAVLSSVCWRHGPLAAWQEDGSFCPLTRNKLVDYEQGFSEEIWQRMVPVPHWTFHAAYPLRGCGVSMPWLVWEGYQEGLGLAVMLICESVSPKWVRGCVLAGKCVGDAVVRSAREFRVGFVGRREASSCKRSSKKNFCNVSLEFGSNMLKDKNIPYFFPARTTSPPSPRHQGRSETAPRRRVPERVTAQSQGPPLPRRLPRGRGAATQPRPVGPQSAHSGGRQVSADSGVLRFGRFHEGSQQLVREDARASPHRPLACVLPQDQRGGWRGAPVLAAA